MFGNNHFCSFFFFFFPSQYGVPSGIDSNSPCTESSWLEFCFSFTVGVLSFGHYAAGYDLYTHKTHSLKSIHLQEKTDLISWNWNTSEFESFSIIHPFYLEVRSIYIWYCPGCSTPTFGASELFNLRNALMTREKWFMMIARWCVNSSTLLMRNNEHFWCELTTYAWQYDWKIIHNSRCPKSNNVRYKWNLSHHRNNSANNISFGKAPFENQNTKAKRKETKIKWKKKRIKPNKWDGYRAFKSKWNVALFWILFVEQWNEHNGKHQVS